MNFELKFDAIGTKWQITADIPSKKVQSRLTESIHSRIEAFDKAYSRFRSDSLVTRMSKEAGTFTLPDDGYPLLHFYEQLYRATNGAVTPLIGDVISDAGYDAAYSLQSKKLTKPPSWDEVLSYDEHSITLQKPAILDFGAAGKGYLIDIVGGILRAQGIEEFVINAGGDILQSTLKSDPLLVGLENPFNTQEAVGVVANNNQSICASAGSRRKWGKYTHIINSDTLESPQIVQATWVVASSAMLADGIATALFFTDPDKIKSSIQFAYAILRQDMSLEYGQGFPVVAIHKA